MFHRIRFIFSYWCAINTASKMSNSKFTFYIYCIFQVIICWVLKYAYYFLNTTVVNSDRLRIYCRCIYMKIDLTILAAVHKASKENSTLFTPHFSFFIHAPRPSRFVPSCMRNGTYISHRALTCYKEEWWRRETDVDNFFDLLLFNDLLPAFDANIVSLAFYSIIISTRSLKIWVIQVFYTFNNYRKCY